MKFNGWKNYETWNIALWVGNDEHLYSVARQAKNYIDLVLKLKEQGIEQTPDGVFYAQKGISIRELNSMIKELQS